MKEFTSFDDSFNIGKTLSYDLAIQVSTMGYAYSVLDTIRNKYVAIKSAKFETEVPATEIAKNLEKVLKQDGFLTKKYKSIFFLGCTPKTILVPLVLFDKSSLKQYFEFNHQLNHFDEIHFNQLPEAGAYNVFTLNSDVTTLLINKFPKIKFYHQNTPFVNAAIRNNQNKKNDTVFANFTANNLTLLVLSEKKLRLINSFYFHASADAVFFVLNLYYQLGLKFEFNDLYLSGDIDKKSEIYSEIKSFVKNVSFNQVQNKYNFPFNEESYPIVNLLNVHQCE